MYNYYVYTDFIIIREKYVNQKAVTLEQTLLTALRPRQILTTVNILLEETDGNTRWKIAIVFV